ncbi:hypothetical protein F5Y12DRAFT_774573 [Xylaria sp. FL1777]|nr:hypothetical protein F5Y12DRAFT_774573 [Xylaria sp. FL1777]
MKSLTCLGSLLQFCCWLEAKVSSTILKISSIFKYGSLRFPVGLSTSLFAATGFCWASCFIGGAVSDRSLIIVKYRMHDSRVIL